MPHIYVDFDAADGPFSGVQSFICFGENHAEQLDDFKRITIFPEEFEDPITRFIDDRTLSLPSYVSDVIRKGWSGDFTLYDCKGAMDFLQVGDIIALQDVKEGNGQQLFIKITHRRSENGMKILSRRSSNPMDLASIESQIGRTLTEEDTVEILEFERLPPWELHMVKGS